MNSKTANLIALELGILIAIMAWLAFSRFPARNPGTAAEVQEGTANSFATIAPILKSRNQARPAVDYRADSEPAQPGGEESAPTVQQYDQQIATAPYANSDLEDGFIAGGSPYYAEVDQEPVVTPPAYIVSPVTQIVEYAHPTEIIIVSTPRSFVNRPQSQPCFGSRHVVVTHRRLPQAPTDRTAVGGGPESQPRVGGVVPRRKINPRSPQLTQGLRVRWNP